MSDAYGQFSMLVLLYFGNFSASKFHINIKIMEEFMKDVLAGVSFFVIIILLPEGESRF